MSHLEGLTYVEGAALAREIPTNEVSDEAKRAFRQAFHQVLWPYLYRCDQDNRDWITRQIAVISRCVSSGKSLDQTLDALAQNALEHNRT